MTQKKQIFKLDILKKLLNDENSCVSLVRSTRLLGLPPFFLTDMKSGVLYLLNSMLKKYDRSLGGIVIGYQNIKILMDENTGIIPIGTSEMEVNISVEFYIFQPKIGSYLEGVINKKSNNHVGCLVHKYFNATILKSEDVLYEDWICKDLNVDDKIIFKVKDLDFTTLLPYIEGIYDGRHSLDKVESSAGENCDTDVFATNLNKSCQNDVLFSSKCIKGRTGYTDSIFDDHFVDSKKCTEEVNVTDITTNLERNQSLTDMGMKEKIEEKEKHLSGEHNIEGNEEKISKNNEMIIYGTSEKLEDKGTPEKRKKKKKKKKADEINGQEVLTQVENVKKEMNSTILPGHIQEKILQIDDENSNDFVKDSKIKVGKKRKTQNEESVTIFNKINEVEDSVLYSTQLDPVVGSKKMRISCCSPIPQSIPFENKADKTTTFMEHLKSVDNADALGKETKKKHKKRKGEKQEDLEDSLDSKLMKISNMSSSKKEEAEVGVSIGEKMSLMKLMMEEVFREQLNKVKEELHLSSSGKESLKEEKRTKKKKKEIRQNESLEVNKYTKSQVNGDAHLRNDESCKQELQRVKEELSMSDRESFKESKKNKAKKQDDWEASKEKTKEKTNKVQETKSGQINNANDNEIPDLRSMMDELFKQQINRVREELSKKYAEKAVKKKRRKQPTKIQEISGESTQDSLYDKLLKEAKSSMVEKIFTPILPSVTDSGRKKKESEFSDVSTSSSKKDSKKKSKQKAKDYQKTPYKYKNGNMFDVAPTPEKINPDKSLFSDSEQSHMSPIKKKKEVNGNEAESRKSKVQNKIDELYKEEMKRLQSDSAGESSKSLEKNSKKSSKTEEKSQVSSGKEESLYEKLLNQAKSLIDARDASVPNKKEKKKDKEKGKKKEKSGVFDRVNIRKNQF